MGRTKARRKSKPKRAPGPQRRVVTVQEMQALLGRSREALPEADFELLKAMTDTLAFLVQQLECKGTSLAKLRWWLFGTTEKTANICPEAAAGATSGSHPAPEEGEGDRPQPLGSRISIAMAVSTFFPGARPPDSPGSAPPIEVSSISTLPLRRSLSGRTNTERSR